LADDASTVERGSKEEDESFLLVVMVLGKKLPDDEESCATLMPLSMPEGRREEESLEDDVGFSPCAMGEAGRFKLVVLELLTGFIKTVVEEFSGLYPG
jgi:hypothetical protein